MTTLRIIDGETIRRLAPPKDLIDWMKEAMIAVSDRDVELPLRRGMPLPGGRGAIGMMPGFIGGAADAAGVKLVSLVPPDRRKGSSHLGLMVLYDGDGLVPQAILCGATITALRTAAMSAAATDALAREDARTLAIFGAGEQAEAHVDALCAIRDFKHITLWARRPEQAKALVARLRGRHKAAFEIAGETHAAAKNADVICTVTGASDPFLFARDIAPGTHINLVGSSFPDKREASDDLVTASAFYIDYLPSTLDQAGEFLHARDAGIIDESHIQSEIGRVFSGAYQGRETREEITVYKSLGVAAQDIMTASNIFRRAEKADLGACASV